MARPRASHPVACDLIRGGARTRERFDWKPLPLGAEALSRKVAALRRGLDVDKINNATAASGDAGPFDLALANELYATLLGPVEPLVEDKRSLLVVPSGALTALPFHLLVTKRPAAAIPEKIEGYRDAAWLLKAARGLTTVGYADFWQGAGVDRARLAPDRSGVCTAALVLRRLIYKICDSWWRFGRRRLLAQHADQVRAAASVSWINDPPGNKPNTRGSAWQPRGSSVLRFRTEPGRLYRRSPREARLAASARSGYAGSGRIIRCKRRAYATVPSVPTNLV